MMRALALEELWVMDNVWIGPIALTLTPGCHEAAMFFPARHYTPNCTELIII